MEHVLVVRVVENDSVSVSIVRTVTLVRNERDSGRTTLLRLDEIGTAVQVELTRSRRVIAREDEGKEVGRDVGREGFQDGSTDSVRAIDCESGKEVTAFLETVAQR